MRLTITISTIAIVFFLFSSQPTVAQNVDSKVYKVSGLGDSYKVRYRMVGDDVVAVWQAGNPFSQIQLIFFDGYYATFYTFWNTVNDHGTSSHFQKNLIPEISAMIMHEHNQRKYKVLGSHHLVNKLVVWKGIDPIISPGLSIGFWQFQPRAEVMVIPAKSLQPQRKATHGDIDPVVLIFRTVKKFLTKEKLNAVKRFLINHVFDNNHD